MRSTSRALLCLAAVSLGLVGCKQENDTAAPAATDVSVVVARVQEVELTDYLPGRATAVKLAYIRPQVNGVILKRTFSQGSFVHAGDQLYQIDPAPYQAIYDRGVAALKHGQAELLSATAKTGRYTKLSKINAVSRQEFDDATAAQAEAAADIAAAQAQIAGARVDLTYTKMLAPISGRIGRTMITEGALVTAEQTDPLTTVTQLDPIYVDLTATGETMLRLRRALEADPSQRDPAAGKLFLTLEDGTTYAAPGKLDFAEVIVDRSTGMTTLRATFENNRGVLLPGMFVHANLNLGSEHAVLVPENAVQRDIHDDPYVFIVSDKDRIEQRSVTTSHTSGDNWIVTHGLKDGDRIVVDGLVSAHAGLTVRITKSVNS